MFMFTDATRMQPSILSGMRQLAFAQGRGVLSALGPSCINTGQTLKAEPAMRGAFHFLARIPSNCNALIKVCRLEHSR